MLPPSAAPIALFAGRPKDLEAWRAPLRAAAEEAGLNPSALRLIFDPAEAPADAVDYVIYTPDGPIADLRPYTGLRAILCVWAGVETILEREDLPDGVPVVRMVEPGLTYGMTDYVVGHVMRWHLDLDASVARSKAARWDTAHPPLSMERTIGVMGLGALGADAIRALAALRFRLVGWSRTRKDLPDCECFAGYDELETFLRRCDALITLVPLTPETRGLLTEARLRLLKPGGFVINVARGPVLPEAGLLAALEDHLSGATLDVFDEEPLPPEHPYWTHPKILVTPHIASVTRPVTASKELIQQILRCERGEPLRHVVDRARGY